VQGVAQHEGDLFLLAQVGKPVPGEHALAGDDHVVAEGGEGATDGLGGRRDGAAEGDGAGGIEDADGEGPGVEVDAAVESVLLVVESHHGLRVRGYLSLSTSSMPVATRP